MKQLQIFRDVASLVFPNLCLACEQPLSTGEKMLCLPCQLTLPKTNYHLQHHNPVEKHFWGRVHIQAATAFYHFIKQTRVQHMIHQLKYKGRTDIGIHLGKLFGYQLQESEFYKSAEIITSVPLHKLKLYKRGYNQSDLLCEGLSEVLHVPFVNNVLVRNTYTQTQTKKSRVERWKNVDSIFSVLHPEKIIGKHVLLIDDVITTGSTLEACANEILRIEGTKVSIAALAHATH